MELWEGGIDYDLGKDKPGRCKSQKTQQEAFLNCL